MEKASEHANELANLSWLELNDDEYDIFSVFFFSRQGQLC